ncbi:uncharacterized protein F5Z01DRAFT_661003, partial [Emericellopsis atlantica]
MPSSHFKATKSSMTDQFQLVVGITLATYTSAVTENPIYEETLVEAIRETLEPANEYTNVVDLNGANMALDGLYMFLNLRQDLTTDEPAIDRAFAEWQKVDVQEVFSKPRGGDPEFQVIVTRDTLKALGRGVRAKGGAMETKAIYRNRVVPIIIGFADRWQRAQTTDETALGQLAYDVYRSDMITKSDALQPISMARPKFHGDARFVLLKTVTLLHAQFARDVLKKQFQYINTCTSYPKEWDTTRSLEDLKLAALSAPTGEALDDAIKQITAVITSEAAADLCVSIRLSKFMTEMLGDFIKAIMEEPSQTNPQESEDMDVQPGTAAVADVEDEDDGAYSEFEGF